MPPEKEAIATVLNYYLSLTTIIVGIIAVVWMGVLIYKWNTKKDNAVFSFISKYALPFGFFISLGGSALTLYYSEILGLVPCGLCWIQRILLYPQIVLFGLAWLKKDISIFFYTKWLSIAGLIVAIYHNYIQLGYNPLFPCPVTAVFADCAVPPFVEFGFVTFPFMAVVLFGVLILLSLTARRGSR